MNADTVTPFAAPADTTLQRWRSLLTERLRAYPLGAKLTLSELLLIVASYRGTGKVSALMATRMREAMNDSGWKESRNDAEGLICEGLRILYTKERG